ncbi:uncharacterized protein LOC123541821 [Mercenaria mercenaria]|uniref:uncharacterized protein LOC123541821 n=1 Tax=Mercenaria mercenaria TaxID=6596 RepID=UPI00234EB117|nr:uncharacterized protein LOC123541821 [Mercenaria mercenaria]
MRLFSLFSQKPSDACTADTTPDSSEQTCNKYTECKYNEPPLNGKIVGNMNRVGDRIQYKCDFCSLFSSECKFNKPPFNECKFNEPPLNGKIVGNMNGVGDLIQYKCDFGYEVPRESEYAVCQPDGKWSVIVDECTKKTNVALGKQTVMSSVHDDHDGAKGVDGNTNQYFGKDSCFHTELQTDPWWRVDLGDIYDIFHVTLFNRIGDECEGVECNRRASDLRLSMGMTLESLYIVGTVPDQIEDIHTFHFLEGQQARYVKVTLEGEKNLHLCEVQVFGFPRTFTLEKPVRSGQ